MKMLKKKPRLGLYSDLLQNGTVSSLSHDPPTQFYGSQNNHLCTINKNIYNLPMFKKKRGTNMPLCGPALKVDGCTVSHAEPLCQVSSRLSGSSCRIQKKDKIISLQREIKQRENGSTPFSPSFPVGFVLSG